MFKNNCTGGHGGKGTWGGLLDIEDGHVDDPNDPNYISDKVIELKFSSKILNGDLSLCYV